MGLGITAPGSGIISHGIGISSFLSDQETDYTILLGSGTKNCDAFGFKVDNFGYKKESAMKKHTSLRP